MLFRHSVSYSPLEYASLLSFLLSFASADCLMHLLSHVLRCVARRKTAEPHDLRHGRAFGQSLVSCAAHLPDHHNPAFSSPSTFHYWYPIRRLTDFPVLTVETDRVSSFWRHLRPLLLTYRHRYGIVGLKALARSKFAHEIDLYLESSEFPEACQEAYESTFHTDRGLRNVIVQAFRANPSLSMRPDVEMVVRETPSLAFELFRMASGLPISS
jgi:hypothetical protein